MKNTPLLAAAVAISLGATSTLAMAQHRGGPQMDFETIDADGDGQITQAEITAFEAARFAEADTDGDGQLTKEEILAEISNNESSRAERRIERMISHLDENEDGTISLEERQSTERAERMFERMDADDDGSISQAEAEEASEGRKGRKGGKGKGGKGGKGHRNGRG